MLLLLAVMPASGAELRYEVSGVPEPLLSNVQRHVQAFRLARGAEIRERDFERVIAEAVSKAAIALRPYGYYHAVVTGNITTTSDNGVVLRLHVDPGVPIIVEALEIEILGEGATREELIAWRSSWPLQVGSVLDQTVWSMQKKAGLEIASQFGFLDARFLTHALEIDLERSRATLKLTMDTGKRYIFGDISWGEHVLKPGIVEYIPRFEPGEAYTQRLMDKLRRDLWNSGYFTDVRVEEKRVKDAAQPVVNLSVYLETSTRNAYQGSLGFGTDTGLRAQAQYTRQPMSHNGDRLDIGAGWQEKDDEVSLRGTYRLPRANRARQFWVSDFILKNENQDFVLRRSLQDERELTIAVGKVDEQHLRLGRLKLRNFRSGEQQALETIFVQMLNGRRSLRAVGEIGLTPLLDRNPELASLLRSEETTLSVGYDYDLVAVLGKGWETQGHRERGWIFTSNEKFGSNSDFTQVYFSTRRSYLAADRWKFILRAEVGYTDAPVESFEIDTGSDIVPLSVTRLPVFYRFKAGGGDSVRGYQYEELSNNQIGSNNIVTASAEVEMKFRDNWSVALFADIGNAFNDWRQRDLKAGIGMGLRWYSIAGPIRVDLAQAQDIDGKPWRVHFTIGTPLL
ncbi:MAG: BamA/TamA family outer membrane protein [Gammaproteobacteria bacterium]|nr:BamA/TamA family outer membrane protein [Gammaproteobacteria bacterium]